MKKGDVCGGLYSFGLKEVCWLYALIYVLRSQFARMDYFQLHVKEIYGSIACTSHKKHYKRSMFPLSLGLFLGRTNRMHVPFSFSLTYLDS